MIVLIMHLFASGFLSGKCSHHLPHFTYVQHSATCQAEGSLTSDIGRKASPVSHNVDS